MYTVFPAGQQGSVRIYDIVTSHAFPAVVDDDTAAKLQGNPLVRVIRLPDPEPYPSVTPSARDTNRPAGEHGPKRIICDPELGDIDADALIESETAPTPTPRRSPRHK